MSIPRVPNRPSADLVRRQAEAINRALKNTNGLSSSQTAIALDRDLGVTGNVDVSGVYEVDSVQVVGNRSTGWAADTGTAEKTAHATYTKGANLTFTDPPTAAEMSALVTRLANIETALQNASRGKKAVKDALIAHGLIGT